MTKPLSSPILIGTAYALTSTLMISVMNMFVKLLSEHEFHPVELAFLRNFCGIFVILSLILLTQRNFNLFKTKRIKGHFMRTFIGMSGVITIYAAFIYLPLTTATVIVFTSSLIIPIFGYFFLKEHVGVYRWSAIFIGFLGVVVMTGFSPTISLIGFACGIFGAICNAGTHIAMRSLAKTEHALTTSFYFMVLGTLITFPIAPFFMSGNYTLDIAPYLIGLILFGSLSHITKNGMYKYIEPSYAAPFPYTALIWAALFDFTIFGFLPGWSIWVGGGLVIFSNLFIVYREYNLTARQSARPEKSNDVQNVSN